MLVGVPMSVLMPTTLEAMTSGSKKASGLMPIEMAI